MENKAGFLQASIGKKVVVAVTGVIFFGFVLGHMIGNLQIYLGRDTLNSYAHFLQHDIGSLLWVARIVLILSLVLHVFYTISLNLQNKKARPVGYQSKNWVKATLTSRTMVLSGLVILAFVIYHLLHFTLGVTNPDHFAMKDPQGRHDVYSMVVLGFEMPAIAAAYIIANILLAMHVSHGVSSLFQTLGLALPEYKSRINAFALTFAGIILVGNVSIPLSVLLGVVTLQ